MPGILLLALLLLTAVLASKTSGRLGVPALLFFLLIGWAVGPHALGMVSVGNLEWVRDVGVVALSLILFSGGLDTRVSAVRPVVWRSTSLATVGVVVTALAMALGAYLLLPMSFAEAFLLGSIVSSTDAAAVFSVLRSRSVGLHHNLRPILESESGSNDPMALLLTNASLAWVIGESLSPTLLPLMLLLQLALGAGLGLLIGWGALRLINRIRLAYEGLFSVLMLSFALLTYGLTELAHGNGLLAVYCAGIVIGNQPFMHKQSSLKFFDGLAWIMQITIFITLGLLIVPSDLRAYALPGVALSLLLMLVARTSGVFTALLPFRGISTRERLFISWGGLKGAAPLVFALYPLLAIPSGMDAGVARGILNIVCYIVVLSVLLQGTTLTKVAQWLGLSYPVGERTFYPVEIEERSNFRSLLREVVVPAGSHAHNKTLVELNLPRNALFILISRGGEFIMPNGATRLCCGDKILVLAPSQEVIATLLTRLGEMDGTAHAPPSPHAPCGDCMATT